jgi:antitoxin HicB
MTKYPYSVEQKEDGKFLVQFLDFPEGITEGDTEEEAEANASEVLLLLVGYYSANGEMLPEPSAIVTKAGVRHAAVSVWAEK